MPIKSLGMNKKYLNIVIFSYNVIFLCKIQLCIFYKTIFTCCFKIYILKRALWFINKDGKRKTFLAGRFVASLANWALKRKMFTIWILYCIKWRSTNCLYLLLCVLYSLSQTFNLCEKNNHETHIFINPFL